MHNLLLGPICIYNNTDQIEGQCQDILGEGWIAILRMEKGEFYEIMKGRMHLNTQSQMMGVIIAFGYIKPYEA